MLTAMDLEKLNMFQVVQKVYEGTYMRYHLKFFEEKMMREKLEARIIDKNKEIDRLHAKIKELEDGEEGTPVSEDSEAETQGD